MTREFKLVEVKLKNILSHRETSVRFPEGVVAIIGPNGAGKSTIVDSIVYALFDTGRWNLRGDSKRDLVRRGAAEGIIEVVFEAGGKRYRVVRKISSLNRPEEARLTMIDGSNEKLIAVGPDNVVKSITALMGLPSPDSVRYSIIARQGELTRLLDMQPSQRKEFVLRLLGLRSLDVAQQIIREVLDDELKIRDAIGRHSRIIEEISEVEEELKRRRSEVAKIREELKEVELEEEKLVEEVSRWDELVKKVREYVDAKRAVEIYRRCKELEEEMSALRRYLQFEQTLKVIDVSGVKRLNQIKASVESELRKSRQQFLELKDKIVAKFADVQDKLRKLGASMNTSVDLSNTTRELEEALTEIVKAVEYLEKQLAKSEAEIQILKNSAAIISDSGTCPICRRPLDDVLKESLRNDIAYRVEELTKRTELSRKLIESVKSEIQDIRRMLSKAIRIEGEMDELRKRLEEISRDYYPIAEKSSEMCAQIERSPLRSALGEVGGCLELIEKAVEFVNKARGKYEASSSMWTKLCRDIPYLEISEAEKNIEVLAGLLRSEGLDPENVNLDEVEKRAADLRRMLTEFEAKRSRLEARLAEAEKRIEELENKRRDLNAEKQRLEKSIKVLKVLDYVTKNVLGKDGVLAKKLSEAARRAIDVNANTILRSLGLDLRIRIDDEFNIKVLSSLGEIPVDSISGGELTAVALSIRLALAYSLLGRIPGFMILDEPTAHLDSDRRRGLFEVIKKVSKTVPQIIVVTHDQEVQDVADKVMFVIKEGTTSKVLES